MIETTDRVERHTVRTGCGREITVGRLRFRGREHPHGRVTLDVGLQPYDHDDAWVSLTSGEARRLALSLLAEAAAVERDDEPGEAAEPGRLEVTHVDGEAYAIRVRHHTLLVDQPPELGHDGAPTPVETLVASLAACVAFYSGRFLTRHGLSREGMRVTAEYGMAPDRPARVGHVRLRLTVPGLPEERRRALHAVAMHCTVHNTLLRPPEVTVELA
jgi:putative redox protein